jgi:hypothetical protein
MRLSPLPLLLEALADGVEGLIIQFERGWLAIKIAWLESEIAYLDRQIEKQQRILAALEANARLDRV